MPIPEPAIFRPSNLTKEQRQQQLAAVYGVSVTPELTETDIERMRQLLQQHDLKRKPAQIHDLNNPPREPYRFQKFPQMIYRDSATRIVRSEAELSDALALGWTEQPVSFHQEREESLNPQYQAEAARVQEQINEAKRRRKAEVA